MRVLIGYDGSTSAQEAIADLRCAGLPASGTALVVSVADVLPLAPEPTEIPATPARERAKQVALKAIAEARALCTQGTASAVRALPDWQVAGEALPASPFWGLIQRAEAWGADLMVVGAHGKSPLDRLLMGSVSQTVVRHAPCSVRIGRESKCDEAKPVRLLVGVDGSPGSDAAVSALAARRWPVGSSVAVVAIVDPVIKTASASTAAHALAHWTRADDQEPEAWVARALDAAVSQLLPAGLKAEPILREGDAKRELVKLAQELGVDCIFVGARGLTRVERLLLGSVSASVAARAKCSVEVVRR